MKLRISENKSVYSGVSLTGIPDNETLNILIRYPDKFYPEFGGLVIRNFKAVPVKFLITRPYLLELT